MAQQPLPKPTLPTPQVVAQPKATQTPGPTTGVLPVKSGPTATQLPRQTLPPAVTRPPVPGGTPLPGSLQKPPAAHQPQPTTVAPSQSGMSPAAAQQSVPPTSPPTASIGLPQSPSLSAVTPASQFNPPAVAATPAPTQPPKKQIKTAQAAKPAQPASGGRRLLKWLPLVAGLLILLVVVVYAAVSLLGGGERSSVSTSPLQPNTAPPPTTGQPSAGGQSGDQVVLTYWGLWEPESVMQPILDEFSRLNPGVIVQYQRQSHREYRQRLQTAISQGSGPDLFRYHLSWGAMLVNELDAVPTATLSEQEFVDSFYPSAREFCTINDSLRCIPLMYDGLGLYINTEAFQTAALTPPSTWAELQQAARQLTITDGAGQIQRGGVALGNATNVEHFSDVLGLLLVQNGADPSNPSDQAAIDALQFYTDFQNQDQVWDDTLPPATIAFAREEVAMMIAPSWRAHEVKAQNPALQFEIVEVPKLTTNPVGWANYWVEGVNRQSQNREIAWGLLKYLSNPQVQQEIYSAARGSRDFGPLYSQRELASQLSLGTSASYTKAIIDDAQTATSWYLNGYTHDNGLNDQITQYWQDAVNAVLNGTDPAEALETVTQGTAQVLRQYGLSVGP